MDIKKLVLWFCIGLMLLFAFFQWNDPDPHVWIPLYLVIAYLGYRKLDKRDPKSTYLIVAVVYLLWGISLLPPVWEGVMLDEMGMKSINVELGRESFGLFICALILGIFGFWD